MSRSAGMLILQAAADGFRVVRADGGAQPVKLSRACSFLTGERAGDASPLTDEAALQSFASYVTQNGWRGQDLICVLGGPSVACHFYDLPPLAGSALRQAVLLKLSQQLHFEVSDAVVAMDAGTKVPGTVDQQVRVQVTAVHREHAQAAVNAAARTGLNLKAITAMPAVLGALAREALAPQAGLYGVLYVDEQASTLIVFDGALICVATELPIGVYALTKALMRPIIAGEDFIQLKEDEAAAFRREVGIPAADQQIEPLGVTGDRVLPLLEPVLQQFAKHIVQWLTFASTTANSGPIQGLSVVGPGATVKGLAETLARRLSTNVQAEDWLEDRAALDGQGQELSLAPFAPAAGAARHWRMLPNLIPPELLKERKLDSIRRRVSTCALVAAAAIACLAVLFDRLASSSRPAMPGQEAQLADIRQIVALNNQRRLEQQAVAELQDHFDDFAGSTPSWIGIFKELSLLLPSGVQATGFEARIVDGRLRLTVNGAVYTNAETQGFNDAVEQTLRLLQRSAFFESVQLRSANGVPNGQKAGAAGNFSVEVALVYPGVRK